MKNLVGSLVKISVKTRNFSGKVKKVRGGERSGDVQMRGEDGELGRGESELKRIWKGYFEQLMNNEAEGEGV